MKKLAILGAGSWGLTLAWLASHSNKSEKAVWLWGRNPEKIAAMATNRRITSPVTMTLPEDINLTDDLGEAVAGADVVLLVVTSNGTREVLEKLVTLPGFSEKTVLLNASKGIEYPSLKTLCEVIHEVTPHNPSAVLSGPTLAQEILNGQPTAAVIASEDLAVAEFLQQMFSTDLFRIYTNEDMIGVELGGSLKNIFAIVSGYMVSKNLGDNARATLITRGLAEMARFSVAMGADVQTIYGLSGLGDLLATCSSPLSRNYQVGYGLGRGKTVDEILKELNMVAEGVRTTHAVHQLSKDMKLDMPVVKQVELALTGDLSETEMIHTLMSRRLKSEGLSC